MLSTPRIIPSETGRARAFMGFLMDWKVTGQETGGAFSMTEMSGSRGAGPPLHYHQNADEFFYVVDGTMTFKVGAEVRTIGDGGFVWIPRTTVHAFQINSDDSRFLFGFVPAGVEQMFIEASTIAAARTNQPAVAPGSNREQFGTMVVGPPLGEWLRQNHIQVV